MIDGMPAKMSIKNFINFKNFVFFKNCVEKIADPTPIGTAISNEKNSTYNVLIIIGINVLKNPESENRKFFKFNLAIPLIMMNVKKKMKNAQEIKAQNLINCSKKKSAG